MVAETPASGGARNLILAAVIFAVHRPGDRLDRRAADPEATHAVLLCMSGVMAVAAIMAFVGLRRGVEVESGPSPVGVD